MTRTKAPNARIVPHIRGKPATWLTPLPPNRGPTEAEERKKVVLQTEEQRFNLKRGLNLEVRQDIARRGREPTVAVIDPTRSVSRQNHDYPGTRGYRSDHRIRGSNLQVTVSLSRRVVRMIDLCSGRQRCRGEIRAGDIEINSFVCGTRCPGREGDAAG